MKKNFLPALWSFLTFLVYFVLARTVFWVSSPHSVYTVGWAGKHFLPVAAAIGVYLSLRKGGLWGWLSVLAYSAGVLLGELLGGFRADVPPQYRHDGWWICILSYFVILILCGAVLNIKQKQN